MLTPSRFVPRCEEKAFDALASVSPKAQEYYKATNGAIFSSNDTGIMHLGYVLTAPEYKLYRFNQTASLICPQIPG